MSKGMRYLELGPLAEGGMAVLTLARRDDDLEVVVKRIRPPFDQDASYRALFLDEGRIAAALDHPRIVRLLDQGEDELGPYLIFEHVEGTDLSCVLDARVSEGRPLELAELLAVAVPLFDALEAAHAACGDDGDCLELVHRDVSPGNVLLGETGEVKLADFGVARSRLKTEQTVAGEMKGKFAYMAPEQTRGECAGPTTDLFAAGIVLWECATAKRLFDGPTDPDIALAVREREVPGVRTENPAIPEALDALIASLLLKDPRARPTSAAVVRERLETIALENGLERGLRRHAAGLARQHPRAPPEEHPHVTELRRRTQRVLGEAPLPRRRSRLAWGGIAGLLVVGVVVVGLIAANGDPSSVRPVRGPPLENGMSVEPAAEPKPAPPKLAVEPRAKPAPARPKPPPRAARPKGVGLLYLQSEPWAEVVIDGRPVGHTPLLKHRLRAGKHRVELTNPHFKLARTIQVDVPADGEARRFVDLNQK